MKWLQFKMSQLFLKTLHERQPPDDFNGLPPFMYYELQTLWKEMNKLWGNLPNIRKWMKSAIRAAKRGTTIEEMQCSLKKYIDDSQYEKRKANILSAVEEFGWQPGYIYILTNRYMPNLIKVGRVFGKGKTVYDRINDKDLNCTGVPCQFNVEFEIYTINSKDSENISHNNLSGRIHGTEFFQNQSIHNAKTKIIEVVKNVDIKAFKTSNGPRQAHFF